MVKIDRWIRGIGGAWEILIDYQLPAFLEKYQTRSADHLARLIGFPLLGLVLGVVPGLIALFCAITFNRVAGCIIFTLLTAVMLGLKDSWRGSGLLLSFLLLRIRGISTSESLNALNPALVKTDSPQVMMLFAIFELMRAIFLALLCLYGSMFWLIVIMVGSFTIQGVLAVLPEIQSGKPFLAIPEENYNKIAIPTAVIYVLLMPFYPVGIIVAGAAVYFIAVGLRRYFLNTFNGITSNWITFAGAITENILLLIGLLLAIQVV